MRFGFVIIAVILALVSGRLPAREPTTYRYVGICDEHLCLIAANGAAMLSLARPSGKLYWGRTTVSPITGTVVAELHSDREPFPAKIYEVAPGTGKLRLILSGSGYRIPETPVWLNDGTLLLERSSKQGLDAGVYTLDTKTGALKQIVPPIDSEFCYNGLVPSPDETLVATMLEVTCASWLSVNDIARGIQTWGDNVSEDGIEGLTGVVWSSDGKSLFASFSHSEEADEPCDTGPGGVWNIDALTGKKSLWKYGGESIDCLWTNSDCTILALSRGNEIDYLRMPEGKLLCRVRASGVGAILDVFFTKADHPVICGTLCAAEIDADGKPIETHVIGDITSDIVRFSRDQNAIMYVTNQGEAVGVLDLTTGAITKFADEYSEVQWLKQDVVR